MITSQERKNYNRAMIILVIGIILALWTMINANTYITASIMYIVIGIVCLFFYNFWDKIKPISGK